MKLTKTTIFTLSFLITMGSFALAGWTTDQFTPQFNPHLVVNHTSDDIKIDGQLDDTAWVLAAIADNFSEHYPGDQTKPPVETRAYITYNDDYLYVAFLCFDDPASIRSSYCERDKIESDDNVRFCLATFGRSDYAYIFYANPDGIQGDALLNYNSEEDDKYDLIWESAGTVTDSGYQVEMAIPFSTLRFSNQADQIWYADFWRNRPRETVAEYSWAALDRDNSCWPCQWGRISGISGAKSGKGIEITPSLLAFQCGNVTGNGDTLSPYVFKNNNPEGELSLWSKYSISSNTTAEVTLNPDFSQIESDAGQIDVNTTYALYYPEQRPFFMEGYDLFRAAIFSLYTRSINDPTYAIKLIRRGDPASIGYLMARDNNSPYILPGQERSNTVMAGKSTTNIIRLKYNIWKTSRIGLFATDQRFDSGGKAFSLAHDAFFRISPALETYYHLAATRTEEFNDSLLTDKISDPDGAIDDQHTRAFDGESYWGHFILSHINWITSTWFSEFEYQECAPTFRQPSGLMRQSGFRAYWIMLGRNFRITSGFFETIQPSIEYESDWKYDGGGIRYRYGRANLLLRLRFAQAKINSSYVHRQESYDGRFYDDIWFLNQNTSLQLNDQFSLSWTITYGHQIARMYYTLGEILNANFQLSVKLNKRILLKQDLDYTKSRNLADNSLLYDGYIGRTSLYYQVSSPLSLRMILEYNDFDKLLSIDPLITYRVSAFSVLYVGVTSKFQSLPEYELDGSFHESNRLVSRQFFAKLQYLFQI